MDLKLNQRFESFNAANAFISEWCKRNNHSIKIERSYRLDSVDQEINEKFTYSYVTFSCIHYGKPRANKNEIRINTKSQKKNCPFHIKIKYDDKEMCMFIYEMNLEHNHELITDPKLQEASLDNRKLNEEQLDNIKLMVKHKMPSKKLKGLIEEQYGKKLSDKDIENIKDTIMKDKNDKPEDEKIADFLNELKQNDAIIEYKKNEDDELEAVFLITNKQLNWYNKYAQMVHIDATFKVNKENYILYVFLSQDSYLHGLPVAYCLLKRENRENMQFMYESFIKNLNKDIIENIMIDKDLQNIDLLKKYFPEANILLCTFHVIKYLKGVVADYESKENKQDVMDIISKMVYCKDDNEYQQLLQKINEKATKDFYNFFYKKLG